MQVASNIFQHFYRVLRAKFLEKEFAGNFDAGRGDETPLIWLEEKDDEDGKPYNIAERLFSGLRTSNGKYFYLKSREITPEKMENGLIDDLAFIKALLYVGIAVPDTVKDWDKLPLKKQAKILHDEYVLKYSLNSTLENQPEDGTVEPDSTLSPAKKTILKPVEGFYKGIASRKFDLAWSSLSDEFRNRQPWLGDFDKFKVGYTNTNAIRNIEIFGLKQIEVNIAECHVYYEDEVTVYSSKNLGTLDSLTISDIDFFTSAVEHLRKMFREAGKNNIDNIELYRLFEPNASEYLWYNCGIDPKSISDFFHHPTSTVVKRLHDVSLIEFEDKWYIQRINGVRTFSAR